MKKYIAFIVQKLGHCIKFIKYIYNFNLYRNNNNNKIEKYLQYTQTKRSSWTLQEPWVWCGLKNTSCQRVK